MARAGGKDRGLYEVWWVQYAYTDEKGKSRVCKEKAGTSKDGALKFVEKRATERPGMKDVRYSSEWWIVYFDAEGKRRREKAGSKSQAQKLYEKCKTEKLRGVKLPETLRSRQTEQASSTIAEMIELYRSKFEAKASGSDDARYARYWIEDFGTTPMDELTASDIEKWRDKRLAEPPTLGGPKRLEKTKSVVKKRRSPATVNRPVAFLKRIYNLAIRDLANPEFKGLRVREGFHRYNPAAQVDLLKENNERVRFLSEAEEERLREAMEPEAFRLVEVAFLTGMRMAEQFKLKRACVDLRTGTLTIPKSKDGEKPAPAPGAGGRPPPRLPCAPNEVRSP